MQSGTYTTKQGGGAVGRGWLQFSENQELIARGYYQRERGEVIDVLKGKGGMNLQGIENFALNLSMQLWVIQLNKIIIDTT